MWTKPAATEMRFGFEVTMYVMNKQQYSLIVPAWTFGRKK